MWTQVDSGGLPLPSELPPGRTRFEQFHHKCIRTSCDSLSLPVLTLRSIKWRTGNSETCCNWGWCQCDVSVMSQWCQLSVNIKLFSLSDPRFHFHISQSCKLTFGFDPDEDWRSASPSSSSPLLKKNPEHLNIKVQKYYQQNYLGWLIILSPESIWVHLKVSCQLYCCFHSSCIDHHYFCEYFMLINWLQISLVSTKCVVQWKYNVAENENENCT